MIEPLLTILGVSGIVLVLIAFIINHKKIVVRATYAYNGLNLLGSAILATYAWLTDASVFLILNLVWVFVAACFLIKITAGKR